MPPCGDPGFPFRIRLFPKFEPVVTPSSGIRNGPLFLDLQFLRGKLAFPHCHHHVAANLAATCRLPGYLQLVFAGRLFEVNSQQTSSLALICALPPQRDTLLVPLPLDFRQRLCAFQFDQQQTSLACFRRAQAQRRFGATSSHIFRHRSGQKQRGACRQNH
jgi:hypothetical protein